jgi:hypothetical protein
MSAKVKASGSIQNTSLFIHSTHLFDFQRPFYYPQYLGATRPRIWSPSFLLLAILKILIRLTRRRRGSTNAFFTQMFGIGGFGRLLLSNQRPVNVTSQIVAKTNIRPFSHRSIQKTVMQLSNSPLITAIHWIVVRTT